VRTEAASDSLGSRIHWKSMTTAFLLWMSSLELTLLVCDQTS
jgi:hypothetical protein